MGEKVALSKGAKVRIPISHANKNFEKIFKKSCKCVASFRVTKYTFFKAMRGKQTIQKMFEHEPLAYMSSFPWGRCLEGNFILLKGKTLKFKPKIGRCP